MGGGWKTPSESSISCLLLYSFSFTVFLLSDEVGSGFMRVGSGDGG